MRGAWPEPRSAPSILLDSEVLDEGIEVGALAQSDDELCLLAPSEALFLLFVFGGDDGGGLDSGDGGVAVSAEKFTDLDSDSDGITESVELNFGEIHQEELGKEDVESGVSLA